MDFNLISILALISTILIKFQKDLPFWGFILWYGISFSVISFIFLLFEFVF